MLRHLDQHDGGVMEYTKMPLGEFFSKFTQHEYILIHTNEDNIGSFGTFDHVREIVSKAPAKLSGTSFLCDV
jgi:hypothetical protein